MITAELFTFRQFANRFAVITALMVVITATLFGFGEFSNRLAVITAALLPSRP